MLPKFFFLKKDIFILFYLGVFHSWDPANPQFNFIREKWTEFLKTAKQPLVIIESHGWEIYQTENESIIKGGEIDFMAFLAAQNNIRIVCFEPNRGDEMNALLKQFSKEQISYYYFARVIAQWHRLTQKPDINSYISQFLQRDQNISGWNNFIFSFENMKNIHKRLFNTELNLDDVEFFEKIENPMREDNPLKDIVRACGKYRNETVIKKIKKAWEQNDLFIVYGYGHAAEHIKELLNDKK